MDKHPLLLVSWNDHSADGSWADVDKFHGPSLCKSIGWIYKEDDVGMTLVSNIGDGGETGNLQYILKACIVTRQEIKVPRRRKGKPKNDAPKPVV